MQRTTAIGVALAVGTLLLYAPVLHFDFINLDDPIYVSGNFHLAAGSLSQKLAWSFQTGLGGYWMPMVWLSYLFDYSIGGFSPSIYHATNVLLHAANAVLLFLVLKRMTGAVGPSAMVAAFFAWHPVHVESVAWITERKDVLSTLFWMLTMLAYLGYARKGGVGRYLLVLLFFTLGLMSKPMLVTLPFILLLTDWWPLGRWQAGEHPWMVKTRGQLILEKMPLLFVALVFCLATAHLQGAAGATSTLARLPLLPRIENALVSYCRYIERTVWPTRLSVIYPLHTWRAMDVLGAILFLAAISDRVFGLRKKFPYLLAGWIWFLVTLIPVIGIIQAGTQGMADRFAYVPSIGLFVMICWGASDLIRHGIALKALSAAALIACGLISAKQLQYWRNGGTLFSHAIDLDSRNFMAHSAYGSYQAENGATQDAISHLRRAVEIVPEFSYGHAFLGHVLYKSGQPDAAIPEIQTALKLKPEDVQARDDLGSIYLDQHHSAEAEAEFDAALRYAPDNPATHCLMGKALARQGKQEEAQAHFAEARRLDPHTPDAHE